MESLAYPYDDMKSIYQAAPQIIRLLIKNDEPSAKEYLKNSGHMTIQEHMFINYLSRRYSVLSDKFVSL